MINGSITIKFKSEKEQGKYLVMDICNASEILFMKIFIRI